MLGAILPLHDVRYLRDTDPAGSISRASLRPGGLKGRARNRHFADEKPLVTRKSHDGKIPAGGARRDRTDDLLLAKQALSQLSYGPLGCWPVIRDRRSGELGGPGKI